MPVRALVRVPTHVPVRVRVPVDVPAVSLSKVSVRVRLFVRVSLFLRVSVPVRDSVRVPVRVSLFVPVPVRFLSVLLSLSPCLCPRDVLKPPDSKETKYSLKSSQELKEISALKKHPKLLHGPFPSFFSLFLS
jgi:hypothetical protein